MAKRKKTEIHTESVDKEIYIKNNRLFYSVFCFMILLHIILMASLRLYPFTDVPNHLASSTIVRYYDNPSNQFNEYYALDTFPKPNVFHLFFCSLSIFPSVETANKVFYCLYVLLLPLSLFLLIRKLEGDIWFSMLSFLILYNFSVKWGFVGFTLALPFILLMCYCFINSMESNTVWRRVVLMVLFTVLFFVHVIATLFCLFLFFLFVLNLSRKSYAKALKESIVVIPPLALIGLWWTSYGSRSGPSTLEYLLNYYKDIHFPTIPGRIISLFSMDNAHMFEGNPGTAIGIFFSLVIIVPLLYRLVWYRKSGSGDVLNGKSAY
ncbi:MAG: hypothetical protein HOC71_06170, partial [Candidatus Latescibacteria bacterium]|nr:hypothetical protein [Candidatus Latescibacterota bacterium]